MSSTTIKVITVLSVLAAIFFILLWIWGSKENSSGPWRPDREAARGMSASVAATAPASSIPPPQDDSKDKAAAMITPTKSDVSRAPAAGQDPPSAAQEATQAVSSPTEPHPPIATIAIATDPATAPQPPQDRNLRFNVSDDDESESERRERRARRKKSKSRRQGRERRRRAKSMEMREGRINTGSTV